MVLALSHSNLSLFIPLFPDILEAFTSEVREPQAEDTGEGAMVALRLDIPEQVLSRSACGNDNPDSVPQKSIERQDVRAG
eukprot:4091787-Amphidinium_carterae.1